MRAAVYILILALVGVYGAPSNVTTTERSSGLSSTIRATTLSAVTSTPGRVNATTRATTSTPPRMATSSNMTGPNRPNSSPSPRQTEQQPDDFERGGNAVVFAGICGPDGCVVRGDVYENVFPVSTL